jgi:uncharacterized protein YjbI with pentapeptide repeats
MTNPQIKHRHTGAVLFEGEAGVTTRDMLDKATIAKANLRGADLSVAMVLASKHLSTADLDDQLAAQDALLRADGRALTGKAWNFDGEGRRAMLVAIDAHEQQIALLGQALVTDALLTVMDMRAKGHVHQVVGVAA